MYIELYISSMFLVCLCACEFHMPSIYCDKENRVYDAVFRCDYLICCLFGIFKYYEESKFLMILAISLSSVDINETIIGFNIARFILNSTITILALILIKTNRIIYFYEASSLLFICFSSSFLLSLLIITFDSYELILTLIMIYLHVNIFIYIFELEIVMDYEN